MIFKLGIILSVLAFVAYAEGDSTSPVKRVKRQVSIGFGNPQGGGNPINGVINGLFGGIFRPNQNQPNFQNPNHHQQGPPHVINPFNFFNQFPGAHNQHRACNVNNGDCEHGCRMRRNRAQCFCTKGYVLNTDKKTCGDINECLENPCQESCTNNEGSFVCSCSGDQVLLKDGKSCGAAAASCSVDNGGCEKICRDKPRGGVRCRCSKRFQLGEDGRSCLDIDECASGTHTCKNNEICSNTHGSFQCTLPGKTSSCSVDNGGCQQNCRENKRGGVRCACRKGFELQSDGTSCLDTDECATGTHGCPELCVNRPGSFQCLSRQEEAGCSENNGGCEQRCRDTKRGIKCNCRKGFALQTDGTSCLATGEPDPCATNNGGCHQICVNNNGVAQCECESGYIIKNGICEPEGPPDPCQINNGGCDQICVATFGLAECKCKEGYTFKNGKCEQRFPSAPQPTTTPPPPPQVGCGVNTKKSLFRRIVGGRPADPRDWPWMAAILRNVGNSQFCGGTLITEQHVLSAAHCFTLVSETDIKVRLGEYDFASADENNPTDFSVASITSHEGYNRENQENDIALLKLSRPSSFSEFIWPVCLPPPNNDFEDQLGYVTGWGTIHFGGPVSQVLQEVVIPVWNQTECIAAYPENTVAESMMCAGLKTGGKDSCQGDSGGPFLVQIFPQTRWYIGGIVSWGIECASPNRPGVYTRVNRYLDWIDANTL